MSITLGNATNYSFLCTDPSGQISYPGGGVVNIDGNVGANSTNAPSGATLNIAGANNTPPPGDGYSNAASAITDANTAYTTLQGLPYTPIGSNLVTNTIGSNPAGTYPPGYYSSTAGYINAIGGGTITLTGTATDVYVFFANGDGIFLETNLNIVLGSVLPANIYWVSYIPSTNSDPSCQIGNTTVDGISGFAGNILGNHQIQFIVPSGFIQQGSVINFGSNTYGIIDVGNNGTVATYEAQTPIVCLHPFSQILTNKGYVCIEDIKSGDIVYNIKYEPVEVLYNIKILRNTQVWVRIQKDAIAHNVPNRDLYITDTHPIFING